MQLSFCAQAVQLFEWFSTCQGTILPFLRQIPKRFLQKCITMQEIWVSHFQTETKEQWKHCEHPWVSGSQESQIIEVCRQGDGFHLRECVAGGLPGKGLGHTITGAYYTDVLRVTDKNQEDFVWEADKRSVLLPEQCFTPQGNDDCHPGLRIWTRATPALFSWFGNCWNNYVNVEGECD